MIVTHVVVPEGTYHRYGMIRQTLTDQEYEMTLIARFGGVIEVKHRTNAAWKEPIYLPVAAVRSFSCAEPIRRS